MEKTTWTEPVAARWMAVGRDHDPDARTAARASVRQALSGGPDPKLLIVFCSPAYDLPTLAKEIRHCSGEVPMIGCTTSGEIGNDGAGEGGVLVTALGGTGFEIRAAAVPVVGDRPREAGAELATMLRPTDHGTARGGNADRGDTDRGNANGDDADGDPGGQENGDRDSRILMLLTNGLNSGQQRMIRGIYGVLGAGIPLVGGAAADDMHIRRTSQLCGDDVFDDALVGAMITSTGPIALGFQHGWRRIGDPMLVTSSCGNRIDTIDDQPALDLYLRLLNAPPECYSDQRAFSEFGVTHPFGFVRRGGETIRSSSTADFAGRAVFTIEEVPQGKLVWVMEGGVDTMLEASEQACADAIEQLGGRPLLGLLVFDCLARRTLLGPEGIRQEVEGMNRRAGGAPLAGFYTYGEIARTSGVNGFHNQTLVAMALG